MALTSQARGWTVEEVASLRGYCVEWAEPGRILVSRRNELFVTANVDQTPRWLGRFPDHWWRIIAARTRLGQRLLRFMFYNVLPLSDGSYFLTFGRQIGRLVDGRVLPIAGLRRPTRVLRSACALTATGDVYFGEYLRNTERGEIYIYRLPARTDRLEVVYTFAAGQVRHVHGVYVDPFQDQRLWCVTGDEQRECHISTTRDGFRTLDVVGGGDETWRCVSLAFTTANVYYGSDGEYISNHLYRIERSSGVRCRLSAVDGPVYYCATLGDDAYFGVTAELCPSQVGRSASVWHVGGDDAGTQVLEVKKDRWPVRYFLAGTWHFAAGFGLKDRVLVHAVALRGVDNRTFELRRTGS